MPEMADLMAAMVRREPRALEELYARFSKSLYNVIFAMVRRREDAEEILCEVFQQAWEKAAAYDGTKGAVYTWLLAMSRNRAIDRLRSKGYRLASGSPDQEALENLEGRDDGNPLDQAMLSERAVRVRGALDRISPDQRRVLEIAYFEGRSQTEIAEALSLPLGTVKSRARDGMKALQGLLKDML
jgi:RNA polymerase sigma-70 factor (ECF subfamily)